MKHTLSRELAQLETETFEIDDVADLRQNMAGFSTSCCSCTRNQGSIGMQWPPTPIPGSRI